MSDATEDASPRPWRIADIEHDYDILDADGKVAARAAHGNRELAALIVAAVNERDRLRDIVRRLHQMCCEDWAHTNAAGHALLREARAAIGEDRP